MRRTIDFLLYDWLGIESLCSRARFTEHSRDTFDSVLSTCERIAAEKFAPFSRLSDTEEPRIEHGSVVLPRAAHEAARAYVDSGILAAAQDYALGGLQLPYVVELVGNAFFSKAAIGLGGGHMLTSANANLLMAYGTELQRDVFAKNELAGRWFGTMCLSEPQAGSSLSDIATRALADGDDCLADPLGPRYRLCGSKMWISNGDHELTENIVHLVLAKIPGPDGKLGSGTKGISLFIVPKKLVDAAGRLTGERNDIALAGLNHKLGYRGIPNCLLNFGEGRFPVCGKSGAVGYLVGQPGDGLRCMFHMMNEARIAVGLGAAMIGYAGYEASLAYARTRLQGRPVGPSGKDHSAPPVRIIEHADVRRMLLAQKAYVQGGLALALYCGRLVDDRKTGSVEQQREAAILLELLTPIAKSWPSEWCLEANSLAIQVHGGYGYTRDFPVEQLWRDNRLNMIHEGTHGIQAIDLLGRKVVMDAGAGLRLLKEKFLLTAGGASAYVELSMYGEALSEAMGQIESATSAAWSTSDAGEALANATPYMRAFGHVIIAWAWLDVALAASQALARDETDPRANHLQGMLATTRYFFDYELPKVSGWLRAVTTRSSVCRTTKEEWFDS